MEIAERGNMGGARSSGELLCSHAQTKIGAINCSGGEIVMPGGRRNKREVPFIRSELGRAGGRFGD